MKRKNYFKILTSTTGLSVLYLFVFCFYFTHEPVLFQWLSDLGDLFYIICSGFVVSYIFYLLVLYFPQVIDNREALTNSELSIEIILIMMHSIVTYPLQKNQKDKKELFSIREEEYKDLIENMDFLSTNSIGIYYAGRRFFMAQDIHYILILLKQIESINRNINRILANSIDAEGLKILNNIKNSMFHVMVEEFQSYNFKNEDTARKINKALHECWGDLWSYRSLYFILKNYAIKNKLEINSFSQYEA